MSQSSDFVRLVVMVKVRTCSRYERLSAKPTTCCVHRIVCFFADAELSLYGSVVDSVSDSVALVVLSLFEGIVVFEFSLWVFEHLFSRNSVG